MTIQFAGHNIKQENLQSRSVSVIINNTKKANYRATLKIMRIPTRLKKCSIVDSICEVRFESSFPPEIVTGMIVGALNSLNISSIEGLPVLQIPEVLRSTDEQLKFAPHYKAIVGDMVLQFGGGVITISSPIPYIGWLAFKPEIQKVLSCLFQSESKLVKKITRVARRTVNFFPMDVLNYTTVEVKTPIEYEKKQYQYVDYYKDSDNLIIRTVIANQASYQESEGSVIDIDAYIDYNSYTGIEAVMEAIERTHTESKKIFFILLCSDFIESMEPEYDDQLK